MTLSSLVFFEVHFSLNSYKKNTITINDQRFNILSQIST